MGFIIGKLESNPNGNYTSFQSAHELQELSLSSSTVPALTVSCGHWASTCWAPVPLLGMFRRALYTFLDALVSCDVHCFLSIAG